MAGGIRSCRSDRRVSAGGIGPSVGDVGLKVVRGVLLVEER